MALHFREVLFAECSLFGLEVDLEAGGGGPPRPNLTAGAVFAQRMGLDGRNGPAEAIRAIPSGRNSDPNIVFRRRQEATVDHVQDTGNAN